MYWNNNNIIAHNHITNDRYAQLDIFYKPSNNILGVYCPANESDKNPF